MDEQVIAYLGRHGTTAMNAEDKYRGQKDEPLDEQGRQDAKDQADFLKDKTIGQAWTSPLSRAKDTAKEVLKGRGIKATSLQSLLPLDAGKYTGLKKADNKEQMKYYHEHTDIPIPGGESIDDINTRTRRPILKGLRIGVRTGKPSYFSVHSSIIHSLGQLLHGDHKAALVEPGGVVEVTFDGKNFHAKPIFKPKEQSEADSQSNEATYAS
jgi:broad specificity phosphatase PhoE